MAQNAAAGHAVAVVGAGPAGLAAAAELGLHGVGCVLIEPRREVSHRRPRAKTTSIRTMEHMRRWGVADAIRSAASLPVAWSQRIIFCTSLSGQRITDFDGVLGLTTERDDRFAESGQQVPQPVVEEVLRRHVARLPGVSLRLGHAVESLTQDENQVALTVRTDDGDAYQLTARYVIGCDGAAGVVRDQIGAGYSGKSDPRPNFNIVFRAPSLGTRLGPAVQYWVPGTGFAGRLDLDGTWWAIFPGVDPSYGAAHLDELVTALAGTAVRFELLASDPWQARMLIAGRFRDRRVFLAGESAHVNPPYGGHGYNTSVADSVNIAWKIAAVEHGWAPPALLDSYEPERRAVVEQTVANAAANLRHLAGDLSTDPDAIQRAKGPEFYSLGLVLGYSYAGSPVIQPGSGSPMIADAVSYRPAAEPGARLPHCWLPDGSSLYDHLGTGFAVLGPAHPSLTELRKRASSRGIPLAVVQPPADYPWRNRYLLIRPDQHIAWTAADPAALDIEAAAGWT